MISEDAGAARINRWIRFCRLAFLVGALCLSGCRGGDRPVRSELVGAVPAVRVGPAVVWGDEDGDGFPDGAELGSENDRRNFRRWMTAIAELQYYRMSEAWNIEQRDCAGLVRFAWREALRRHDRQWLQAMNPGRVEGSDYRLFAPDIAAFTLDRHPLGERLFRIDFGSFAPSDLPGKFADFADARTLKNYNVSLIGRESVRAEPGDLLFFHQPWVQRYPYHVMIFLGEPLHEADGAADWVVYHTGNSVADQGEVRKVRLAALRRHPDPRWHPTESNRHFLGYYRLKILD